MFKPTLGAVWRLSTPRRCGFSALGGVHTRHAKFTTNSPGQKELTILGLECSADDTCAAVVTSNRRILSNIVIKQFREHEVYGGIQAYVAMKAHQRNMPEAIRRALSDANISIEEVDGIAFTRGPGMGGCLGAGLMAAKGIAAALGKPLVGVHHMQAHALTAFLTTSVEELPTFPFLTLLISGGHTLLLLATSTTSFQTLATSNDSSIGHAFDRVSRMLGLEWSDIGPGAALEVFCATGPDDEELPNDLPQFPLPMPGRLDFSYSGVLTAVNRYVTDQGGAEKMEPLRKLAVARAFQRAAAAHLEEKIALALRWCRREGFVIHHLVMSGGVASNMYLRSRIRQLLDTSKSRVPIALLLPPPHLCTDNAVMIAWASMERFRAGDHDDYDVIHMAKWNIEDLAR